MTLKLDVYTFFRHFQLSALHNHHFLLWLIARVLWNILDLVHNVVALEDFTEDNMLAIEPAARRKKQFNKRPLQTYLVMMVVMKN